MIGCAWQGVCAVAARRGLHGQNVRVSEISEAAGTLTAAVIVDGAEAADAAISPDGRWVAWTTSSASEPGAQVSELWLAPVGQAGAPVRVTGGSVGLPRWSPDSAWLFCVAGEELRRLRITADGPAAEGETVLCWRGEISRLAPLAGRGLVGVVAGD